MKKTERIDGELFRRSELSIAHGALTNSKRPKSFVKGIYPTHIEKSEGCYTWDVKGNKYIDFITGLGANLFGACNPEIDEAIRKQLKNGISHSLGTRLEVEFAERVKEFFPFVEQIRVLKTGSEACSAAIKIGRTFYGVCNEKEDLYQLLGNKSFTRVPQGSIQKGWISDSMQRMCGEISSAAICERDKKISAKEICKNSQGGTGGTQTLAEETGKNQEAWKESGLLPGAEEAFKKTLREVWQHKLSSASSGLLETARGRLGMSQASRGISPRVLILTEGYHGHLDPFTGIFPPHYGVVQNPYILPLHENEELIPMAAAVINEPIITDTSVHRLEWLKELREQCTWAQTLLIFDEVITGGRYLEHSVSKAHGISPDLICLGKALGGGLPLAIVGGPKAIMERDYFVSSTFAGETLALAAGLQVFKMLAGKYDIKRLWAEGERFQKTFNSFWPEGLTIEGYPTRGVFKGEPLTKALFMQECIKSGILIGPSFFFNFPHMEVADEALSTFMDILLRIRAGNVKLEGEMPVTPFAETVRTQ